MKTRTLKRDQISTTDATQVRALNLEVVEDYKERLEDKPDSLPPVEVFSDGTGFWLADGFHRLEAARLAGLDTIKAHVHAGGRTDALMHALGSNVEHGYRRTRADKRNAVIRAITEFPTWSGRAIAKLCRVSPDYANELKKALPKTVSADSHEAAQEKRIGLDGVERRMPQREQTSEKSAKLEVNGHTSAVHAARVATPVATPLPPAQPGNGDDNGHDNFESAFRALERHCASVVAAAQSLLAEANRSQRGQVRSRLNVLRVELEALQTGRRNGSCARSRPGCPAGRSDI